MKTYKLADNTIDNQDYLKMINFLKKSRQSIVLLVSMFFLTQCVFAQDDPGILTLERIFSSNEFASERFVPAR